MLPNPDVRALAPSGLGWGHIAIEGLPREMHGSLWFHATTGTQVLSALEWLRLPRSGRNGPQWHASIVDRQQIDPQRPTSSQMLLARCAFGMLDAEEDNHHPGHTRHLFLPVDPSERVDCEFKLDETIVREVDGFEWTNPVDGPCRGCEFENKMKANGLTRPCPIHTTRSVTTGAPQ